MSSCAQKGGAAAPLRVVTSPHTGNGWRSRRQTDHPLVNFLNAPDEFVAPSVNSQRKTARQALSQKKKAPDPYCAPSLGT